MELSAFGALLIELLEKSGRTRADLARIAGIKSRSVMTNIVKAKGQRGAYAPRFAWVKKWAEALDLSKDERDWFLLLGAIAGAGADVEAIAKRLRAGRGTPTKPQPG